MIALAWGCAALVALSGGQLIGIRAGHVWLLSTRTSFQLCQERLTR